MPTATHSLTCVSMLETGRVGRSFAGRLRKSFYVITFASINRQDGQNSFAAKRTRSQVPDRCLRAMIVVLSLTTIGVCNFIAANNMNVVKIAAIVDAIVDITV